MMRRSDCELKVDDKSQEEMFEEIKRETLGCESLDAGEEKVDH